MKKQLFALLIPSLFTFSLSVLTYEEDSNPFNFAQTNFRGGFTFRPFLSPFPKTSLEHTAATQILGVSVDMPMIDYLNAGFLVQVSRGFSNAATLLIDVDFLLKPLIQIPVPWGHLAFYTVLSVGPSAYLGQSPINNNIRTGGQGGGFNTALSLGFDYFFIKYLGVFIEGGYRYTAIFQREQNDKNEFTSTFLNFQLHGGSLMFGFKTLL